MPIKDSNNHVVTNQTAKSGELLSIPKILIGADSFCELIENSTVFVDKSLLIKEFITDFNKVILVTYPRRWGKTINMNMIKTFLEIEVGDSGTPIAANEKFSAAIFTAGKWLDGQKTVLLK